MKDTSWFYRSEEKQKGKATRRSIFNGTSIIQVVDSLVKIFLITMSYERIMENINLFLLNYKIKDQWRFMHVDDASKFTFNFLTGIPCWADANSIYFIN